MAENQHARRELNKPTAPGPSLLNASHTIWAPPYRILHRRSAPVELPAVVRDEREANKSPGFLRNAEKQARWRERHLKNENGTKCRIPLTLEATTKAQLRRLAHHRNCSIPTLIADLVARAERRVTAELSGRALKVYLDPE